VLKAEETGESIMSRADDFFLWLDRVFQRERRPGEEPPKVLYSTFLAALVILLVLVIYIAIPKGSDEPASELGEVEVVPVVPAGRGTCTAKDLPKADFVDHGELPAEVQVKLQAIAKGASLCDLTGLQLLMPPDFNLGQGPDATGADWQTKESEGQPLMRQLAQATTMGWDVAEDGQGTYVWPGISQQGVSQWNNLSEERAAELVAVFGQASVDRWRDTGVYDGYRIGIAPDGSWLYFSGATL
jgi:hypothetical protein